MTASRSDSGAVLFRSQRSHRIDASGATRWEETGEERRSGEQQTCADERQWIGRTDVIQDLGQNTPCTQRKKETDADSKSRLQGALSHDERKDVTPVCAQCHADSNFAGPTRDSIRFHAVNADDREQQSDTPERAKQH